MSRRTTGDLVVFLRSTGATASCFEAADRLVELEEALTTTVATLTGLEDENAELRAELDRMNNR